VLLLETGGVRLQEANLGLAAIADVHAAIVDLRQYQPVIGVVAGSVGCFGGMSIAAGLCSYLLVTQEARLGLNGPQVIEQEAGLEEYDSRDRPFIWSLTGGEQRFATGLVDRYAEDDVAQIRQQVSALLKQGLPAQHAQHSGRTVPATAGASGRRAANRAFSGSRSVSRRALMSAYSLRGLNWFNALSAGTKAVEGLPASLKVADGVLGEQAVRFIAVVADPDNRFVRARHGEVGLLEGWGLAKAVDEVITADQDKPQNAP
jgi:malonate decarboxylase beta subunit